MTVEKCFMLPCNVVSPSPANEFNWVPLLQLEAGSHHAGESGEVTLICPVSTGSWDGLLVAIVSWGRIWAVKSQVWLLEEKGARVCGWIYLGHKGQRVSVHFTFLAMLKLKARSGGGDFSGMWYFPVTDVNIFVEIKWSSQTLATQMWVIALVLKYCSVHLSKETLYVSVP